MIPEPFETFPIKIRLKKMSVFRQKVEVEEEKEVDGRHCRERKTWKQLSCDPHPAMCHLIGRLHFPA
jgi:hypothetical protein